MTSFSEKETITAFSSSLLTGKWWEEPLHSLSGEQWEALCDGCGKCCLHKLQDEDTEEVHFTAVACRYLDHDQVRCHCYTERALKNPDCIVITQDNISEIANWLPVTCAYRLRYQGNPLPEWHPLICGSAEALVAAGQSVKFKCISEDDITENADWEELVLIDMV